MTVGQPERRISPSDSAVDGVRAFGMLPAPSPSGCLQSTARFFHRCLDTAWTLMRIIDHV